MRSALACLKPDAVLVIPSAQPPHKHMGVSSAEAQARLEMTAAAMKSVECAEVSDMELRRGGKSFTVDTLKTLKAERPGDDFVLLMGTDMIESFETWKDFRDILNMAELGVFVRGDDEENRISAAAEVLKAKYGARVSVIHHDAVDISSTEIRNLLPERGGREFLDEEVYEYIIKNKLYGAKADFEWLREKAYVMLKPRRIPHVQGTEQEAERLAKRWGADVEKAREAAILHDITKKEELAAQLILCERYGIIIDEVERNNEKLLHSKTGAETARISFGSDDDVYNAILWHTTGKEDMTMLEKVIYLADYIEPTRDFEGLEELRELAYKDIDAEVLKGLEMSIEEVIGKGTVPHERTVKAAEWLREHTEE